MKVAVVASPGFDDSTLLEFELNKEVLNISKLNFIGGLGVGHMVKKFAMRFKIDTVPFNPDFIKHGRLAASLTNNLIVDYSDKIIAFWNGSNDDVGKMITYARKKGKSVKIINVK